MSIYEYKPVGVCPSKITYEIEDGRVKNVRFTGGCMGNGAGLGALVNGMKEDEVIEKLKGIQCGLRGTSCPDQLARALLSRGK
ncbi:MAG: TIGR03905 family TSCPD domain-containing protein [Clostridiales bacterium]|jgi:uncharacterized protein (TIGR03905 family)|nr:TIGR03905 family TSCPD domain-containing protein [Clostridiales bacterium]